MRKRDRGFTIHTGNSTCKVSLGEILALTFHYTHQFRIHRVQMIGIGADQIEEVVVNETVEIGREPGCGLFSKAGQAVDIVARPNFDRMPEQRLAN